MAINHQSTMDQPWINYNGHNPLPSGKRLHNYGKLQFLMGKSLLLWAIFNSYVTNYQRVITFINH